MTKEMDLQVIGRREYADFPELGIYKVNCKVDTGAYTTAIHCNKIMQEKIDGKDVLVVQVSDHSEECIFEHFFTKKIKNSFGDIEERFIIVTLVRIAGKRIRSVVSLTDRANMRYPVLVGRKLIGKKFLVDVSKVYLGNTIAKSKTSKVK